MKSFNASCGDAEELSKAILESSNGTVLLDNLPAFPRDDVATLLEFLHQHPDTQAELNKAYDANLVYKDAFAFGQGGPGVDMKRVLDLSPDRLAQICASAPHLMKDDRLVQLLETTVLPWWKTLEQKTLPLVLNALEVICGPQVHEDVATNYRMVDYYSVSEENASVVRCGEHRDFGAFTLVFSDTQGLEVECRPGGPLEPIAELERHQCLLLFGWVTAIRSNGRVPAALHRVSPSLSQRRISAVFFCAPKQKSTLLTPNVLVGEPQRYRSVMVGQLRGTISRKWRRREGTLKDGERELEEHEIAMTGMKTQDQVVATMIALQ